MPDALRSSSNHVSIRRRPNPSALETPKQTEAVRSSPRPAHQDTMERGGRALGFVSVRRAATTTPGNVVGVRSGAVKGGATIAKTRAAFDKLAVREDKPGASFAPTVKFLIVGADTTKPKLYLVDGNEHAYHWDFMKNGLGKPVPLDQFNRDTYWNDKRKNIAGTIVAHDAFEDGGTKGRFAFEFWPADTVLPKHITLTHKLVGAALPFAKGKLVYHPASDTQEQTANEAAAALKRAKVPVLTTEKLFDKVAYAPLNPGEGFGVLRLMKAGAAGPPPSVRDVCVYLDPPPNDLAHVAGLITAQPQTPLSHTNLKAKQNDTPNAYVKGIADDPNVKALEGKLVRFQVTPDGWKVEAATEAQAKEYLDRVRPKEEQIAPRDLTKKKIVAFSDLGVADARAFGAKSANLAEMRKIGLGDQTVPDGFGIPFSFYDAFMKHPSLIDARGRKTSPYDWARAMMAEPKFKTDAGYREQQLVAFQEKLKGADVPDALKKQIDDLQAKFPAGTRIRCRSSTNNEDLDGFNGAGLYDSYTHRPREGALSNTVKEVWASLWNFRAFEERDFWRIDHLKAAMGVTVHPNTDDEQANGVALTKNPFDANWRGFYINSQVGENLVTNPEGGAVPEEMLVSAIGEHLEYETQRIRRSNLTDGRPVLTPEQTEELVRALSRVHDHFARALGKDPRDASFGMDVEWKILESGALFIKQARPVVD